MGKKKKEWKKLSSASVERNWIQFQQTTYYLWHADGDMGADPSQRFAIPCFVMLSQNKK